MADTPALKDGDYPCEAKLVIKGGKAYVEFNTMFSLPVGTTIPLLRKENNLMNVGGGGDGIGILNGHAII